VWKPFSEGGLIPQALMWIRAWKEEQRMDIFVDRQVRDERAEIERGAEYLAGDLDAVKEQVKVAESRLVDVLEAELSQAEDRLLSFEAVFDEFFAYVNETQFLNQWFYGQIFLKLGQWIAELLPKLTLWLGAKKWLGQHVASVMKRAQTRLDDAVRGAQKLERLGPDKGFDPRYYNVKTPGASKALGDPLNAFDDIYRALDGFGLDDAGKRRIAENLMKSGRSIYYDRIQDAYAAYVDLQMAKALTTAEIFEHGLPVTGARMPVKDLPQTFDLLFKTKTEKEVAALTYVKRWESLRDSLIAKGQLVSFETFTDRVWPQLREQMLGPMVDMVVPGMAMLDVFPTQMYEGLGQTMRTGVGLVLSEAPAVGAWAGHSAYIGEPVGQDYNPSAFDEVEGIVMALLQERLETEQEALVKSVIEDDWVAFEKEMMAKAKAGEYKNADEFDADITGFMENHEPDLERATAEFLAKELEQLPWDLVDARLEAQAADEPLVAWLERANAVYSALVASTDLGVAKAELGRLLSMIGTAPGAEYQGINLEAHLEGLIAAAGELLDEWIAAEAEGG
jgi:hypothetical protein